MTHLELEIEPDSSARTFVWRNFIGQVTYRILQGFLRRRKPASAITPNLDALGKADDVARIRSSLGISKWQFF